MAGKLVRVRGVIALIALAALCRPEASYAQLSSTAPPPPVIMTDTNGVDLKSGNLVTQSPALGAGAAGAPAIAFSQLDVNFNNNAGTPLIGWIQHYTCGLSDDGCREYLVARLGNRTLTFERPANQNDLTAFTGERLVSDSVLGVVIYDGDDTAWYFSGAFAGSGNESQVYETGTLTRIVYRDGRALNYARANSGDMSVTSNEGYQLVVRAGQSDVRLINTAQDFCDVYAASCTYSQSWPTFSRTVSGNASNTTFTYYDPMSRTTTVNLAAAGGGTDVNIYRPGGLHQFFRRRSVLLYNVGDLSASTMP